jgi:ketosteroid isomerase-like protein
VADPAELTRRLTVQFARSAADWNRGDLPGFLSDYAPESTTSFVSGGHVMKGIDWIRSHYAPRFAPGAVRDSLRFEELEARPLGERYALVTARYVLFRGGAITSSGPFSLVMEERLGGWKILHDHTSSDPR